MVCKGDKGPVWGTKLRAIEAIRHVLSEKMLDEALQRQANSVDQRPASPLNTEARGTGSGT